MAHSNNSKETPANSDLSDIEHKMSWTNNDDRPINNNNKEASDSFDDSMICEDWVDYDDDLDGDASEKSMNQFSADLPPAANVIPPKSDTPCTELQIFKTPKLKKKKVKASPPPSFDELLENLDYNILYLNLTKLLKFLESNNMEVCYSFTLKQYEDFFTMIVRDITHLKSRSLDASYRDICDKIMEAADYKKTGFILTYVYEYRKEFLNVVLVIKKVYLSMEPAGKQSSLSSSSESLMPLSQSSNEADPKILPIPSPANISSGFKIHCLRTTLAFIKNNVTKNIEFPELSKEQAQFMHLLLESVIAFADFDNNIEIKEMYRALWEAVKIYSLKYEFRIKTVDTWGEKKTLVFEKILKEKLAETAVNSDQTANSNKHAVNSNQIAGTSNQIMNPRTETLKPVVPKIDVPKPEAPKPLLPTPVLSKLKKRQRDTLSKLIKKQTKLEKKIAIVKKLPSTFVLDALKSIIEFLSDDQRVSMVFVPKNQDEQVFYRKSIEWCRGKLIGSMFDGEYKRLFGEIEKHLTRMMCRVPNQSKSKMNENTGIKEVTYIKVPKFESCVNDASAQSTSKKTKIKLQNNVNSEGTAANKTEIPKIDESLSKKNEIKLQTNVNSEGTADNKTEIPKIHQSNQISFKSPRPYVWRDSDSETCSDRATSLDRENLGAKDKVTKKAAFRVRSRRDTDLQRKEQLIEALSVPVQSDKAMKMMKGMGWSGGALGARGTGITEPIMPSLDLPKGAGFGHGKPPETVPKKPSIPKIGPCWLSDKQNAQIEPQKSDNDIIVEKTKQLLLNKPSFDTLKITGFSELNFAAPKPENSKVERKKPTKSNVELPKPTKSNVELPDPTKSSVELPKPTKSNVELSKPTKSNVEPPTSKKAKRELPTLTRWNQQLMNTNESTNKFPFPFNFHQDMLNCVYELLTSDETEKTLKYSVVINKRDRKHLHHALEVLKGWGKNTLTNDEQGVTYKLMEKYKEYPDIIIKACLSQDNKEVQFKKVPIPSKKLEANQETPNMDFLSNLINETEEITEIKLTSYIQALAPVCQSKKAFDSQKFRLLIILKILQFAKSYDEEFEVTFNKVIPNKQRLFIESTIEAVNMRIKFGSYPAEIKLSMEIKNNIKDAFLSFMFNHEYTEVTLIKHFRFKRLNRPDNAVRRKSQTTVNLDTFTIDSFSETTNDTDTHANIDKITDKQATGNYYDVTESDTSCISKESNNNTTAKVPTPPSGEQRRILSPYLRLYDKAKTTGTKNNEAFAKENDITDDIRNIVSPINTNYETDKNNIGNGNVIIDNNDNKVIDMKDVDANTKIKEVNDIGVVAEYIMCADSIETVVNNEVFLVDNDIGNASSFSNDEMDGDNNDQPINDDAETTNQHEGNDGKIGNDNMDTTDKILENIEEPVDEYVMFNDSHAYNDHCTENIVKDEIKNIEIPFMNDMDVIQSTDKTMKEIGIDEPMEEINLKKELIKVNSKDDFEDHVYSIKPHDDEVMKTEDETDCDNIFKENLGLSQDNCDNDNQSVEVSHFETVGTRDVPIPLNKIDSEIQNVYIVHNNNPNEIITRERAKEIQKFISNDIVQTKQLPLLMCHGVQNGALIYTCQNKKSFDWLKNTMSSISDLKVIDTKDIQKMAVKFYCLFDFDSKYLFSMLELYNQEISTEEWVVEKKEIHDDFTLFLVRMDKFSINFIHASDLALYAGVDKVEFSLIWE